MEKINTDYKRQTFVFKNLGKTFHNTQTMRKLLKLFLNSS